MIFGSHFCEAGSYLNDAQLFLTSSPLHVLGSINSQYFHIIGNGHQPNSKGLYGHYKDSLLKVDDHPQYKEFRPWHT